MERQSRKYREGKWRSAALSSALLVLAVLLSVACGSGSESAVDVSAGSGEGLSTVDVVRQLTPSVVHVLTIPPRTGDINPASPGVGTGIILQSDGYVLTNNHLIDGAESIVVTLHNGESYSARLVGGDPNPDVAVVKIDAMGLKPAHPGSVESLEVGQDVIAIGHALALPGGPTVSKGVISALGRSIEAGLQDAFVDLIQTDASINPGNSGGPLVNDRGEVVGVNTASFNGGQGINFAINIDDAMTVSRQLIERGSVERGYLGIAPLNLTPVIATHMGVPVQEGILIARVVEGSDAQSAGLRGGDVIVAMDSQPIRNTGDLSRFLLDNHPGQRISVRLYRGESVLETEATLGDMPAF
jgi:serine protease Do